MSQSETSSKRIAIAMPDLDGNEAKYVAECLETNWISSTGRFVEDFETAFAAFCEAEHAVATNNGTTALHLALVAMGVGPGDEVIVPTMTYIASANAVTYCGATPVFVDSEPEALTLDPADVQRKITSRTKAIMPVHLYGRAANMSAIGAIAAEHGLQVVEDAAEAHGARADGQVVGSIGTCSSFSFYGNKVMTTGEGGAVTTNDADLAAELRLLRGQGMDPNRRYWFPKVGFNYRMTNIQAALGLGQLERISAKLSYRESIAKAYDARLVGSAITVPQTPAWTDPVNWLYTVRLPVADGAVRDELMRRMQDDGIETRPSFVPMHQLPPYLDPTARFPVAERFAADGVSLPTHTQLDEADIERVCDRLLKHVADLTGHSS